MYRRNLEAVRSSARVSLPEVEEACHFRSDRTQRTEIPVDVDAGFCGPRSAVEEDDVAGFAVSAILSFERGRRLAQSRPTFLAVSRASACLAQLQQAAEMRLMFIANDLAVSLRNLSIAAEIDRTWRPSPFGQTHQPLQ